MILLNSIVWLGSTWGSLRTIARTKDSQYWHTNTPLILKYKPRFGFPVPTKNPNPSIRMRKSSFWWSWNAVWSCRSSFVRERTAKPSRSKVLTSISTCTISNCNQMMSLRLPRIIFFKYFWPTKNLSSRKYWQANGIITSSTFCNRFRSLGTPLFIRIALCLYAVMEDSTNHLCFLLSCRSSSIDNLELSKGFSCW